MTSVFTSNGGIGGTQIPLISFFHNRIYELLQPVILLNTSLPLIRKYTLTMSSEKSRGSLLQRFRRRLSVRTKRSSQNRPTKDDKTNHPSPVSVLDAFPFQEEENVEIKDSHEITMKEAPAKTEHLCDAVLEHLEHTNEGNDKVTPSIIKEDVDSNSDDNAAPVMKDQAHRPQDLKRTIRSHNKENINLRSPFGSSKSFNSAVLKASTDKQHRVMRESTNIDASQPLKLYEANTSKTAQLKISNASTAPKVTQKDATKSPEQQRVFQPIMFDSTNINTHQPLKSLVENKPQTAKRTISTSNGNTATTGALEDAAKSPEQQRVFIHAGANKNHKGTIVGMYDKRTYKVLINGVERNVRKSSVQYLNDEKSANSSQEAVETNKTASDEPKKVHLTPLQPTAIVSSLNSSDARTCPPVTFRSVKIEKGDNKGRYGKILRTKGEKTFVVDIEGVGVKDVRMKSVFIIENDNPTSLVTTEPIQEEMAIASTEGVGVNAIKKTSVCVLENDAASPETTNIPQGEMAIASTQIPNMSRAETASDMTPRNPISASTPAGSESCRVKITGGTHKGKIGRVVGLKGNKTCVVEIGNVGQVNKRFSSIQFLDSDGLSSCGLPHTSSTTSVAFKRGEEWRVADASRGGTRFVTR